MKISNVKIEDTPFRDEVVFFSGFNSKYDILHVMGSDTTDSLHRYYSFYNLSKIDEKTAVTKKYFWDEGYITFHILKGTLKALVFKRIENYLLNEFNIDYDKRHQIKEKIQKLSLDFIKGYVIVEPVSKNMTIPNYYLYSCGKTEEDIK